MKKFLVFFVILFSIFLLFSENVYALASPNGIEYIESDSNDNTFDLACAYGGNYYITINRGSSEDNGNVDTNTGLLETVAVSDEVLKQYGFMNSNGSLDCPRFLVIDKKTSVVLGFTNTLESDSSIVPYGLKENESSCTGKCNGNQNSNQNDFWSCNYTGPSGTLTTKYDGLYFIYYPDGSFTEVDSNEISPDCSDLFYNKKTDKIQYATYDYNDYIKNHNNFDPKQHDYLCGANRLDYEYYCSGSCKYPGNKNIDCERAKDKIEGITLDLGDFCTNSNARNALKFIGKLLLIAKILVPVLLIVLGTVDFAKAVMSSNTDALQKSGQSLLFRIVAGIAIFFLPTIVNFFFKVIVRTDVFRYEECRVCIFEPGNCD